MNSVAQADRQVNMNKCALMKLVFAFVFFALGLFCLYQAGYVKKYDAFPMPAPEDAKQADPSQGKIVNHYELVQEASYDAITRFPAPKAMRDEAHIKWVLISKARAAACVS